MAEVPDREEVEEVKKGWCWPEGKMRWTERLGLDLEVVRAKRGVRKPWAFWM